MLLFSGVEKIPLASILIEFKAYLKPNNVTRGGSNPIYQYLNENIEMLSEKADNLEAKIHEACSNNETDRVQKLLESKKKEIDVEEIDENGSLYVAVQNENATVVEGLLKIGCNPNITNSNRDIMIKCPLYLAIEKGNLKILKLLFQNNANANLKHMYGETPLHFAVGYGDIQIVKELLDNGADYDAKNRHQITPLLKALEFKRIDIAEILLRYGANINHPCNSSGQTVLNYMAMDGDVEVVEFLLKNGAKIDSVTPLLGCLKSDRIDIAEILLKN